MTGLRRILIERIRRIDPRYLPFADVATPELPLGRLLRLSLFQVSVGFCAVLLVGTLNRVMIVELGVSAALVALMAALPVLAAPFRALIGFRSDVHRSAFGWRRVPFIWTGTMLQFGGLAIMPFALLVLSGDGEGSVVVGQIGAALAFLLVGTGLHTTQTAGLALATDLGRPETRPRIVALMYVVLLAGMIAGGLVFAALLADFSAVRLIQVVQGSAVLCLVLNVVALWKQEARRSAPSPAPDRPTRFSNAWARFARDPHVRRFLAAVGLGTAAFSMQDIILEPYGAEILRLSVAGTTLLAALLAGGALIAFGVAARALAADIDPMRLAALGALVGLLGFPCVIFAGAIDAPTLFRFGVVCIGFGGGLFAVSTLTAAMSLEDKGMTGLALGAWGAVQATCAGVAIAAGGVIRDAVSAIAATGALGPAFLAPSTSYAVVYHLEVLLLFLTLVALGPLVRSARLRPTAGSTRIGLVEMPS